MGLISLVIADRDRLYSKKLAEYIINNHTGTFEVKCCSTPQTLNKWLSGAGRSVDILLIDEGLSSPANKQIMPETTLLLSENREKEGSNSIFKYRRASVLVSEVIRKYVGQNRNCRLPVTNGYRTKVATVCSPSGGTGKSTFAVCLGMQCAQRGMSALYFSLESTPSTSCFFPDNFEFNMSNVIYALKDDCISLDAAVEAASNESRTDSLHFISQTDNAEDLQEMSPKDLERLIFTLTERGKYDVILIDTDSGMNPMSLKAMESSNVVFAILGGGLIAEEKNRAWEKEINLYSTGDGAEILRKTVPVASRSRGEREPAVSGLFCGKSSVELLPFYPELHQSAAHELLSCPEAQYVRKVMELSVKHLPYQRNRTDREAVID